MTTETNIEGGVGAVVTAANADVPPRVIAVVATIPPRHRSCVRLLNELSRQSRRVDGVILVLDGYGDAPAPECPLPVIREYRTATLTGAGARWKVAEDLNPEDILLCLDDDVVLMQAPRFVDALLSEVEKGGAAAAMGFSADGRRAPPGPRSRGDLIYGAGCGLTVRAKHLVGLTQFAESVRTLGGPDALGVLGDDDAIVSAYLWKKNVSIRHAATGNIYAAPGTRASSQSAAHLAQKGKPQTQQHPDAQKLAIKKLTGWPWFGFDNTLPKPKVPFVQR